MAGGGVAVVHRPAVRLQSTVNVLGFRAHPQEWGDFPLEMRNKADMKSRAQSFAPFFLATSAFAWAGNHVIARFIAGEVPPGMLNVLRWLLVAVVLGAISWRTIAADMPTMLRNAGLLFFLGVVGGGVFGTLQFVSLRYTSVVNMGVLNSTAPAFIVAASVLIFRDRVRAIQITGIFVSLAGVVAMVSQLSLERLATFSLNAGDVLIVLNMMLFAVYSACLRLRPPIQLTSFLFSMAVAGAIANIPFVWVEWEAGFLFEPTWKSIGAVAYSGLVSSIVAYICWSRGVDAIGPSRASVYLHLIPFANAGFGALLLGEQLRLDHLVGLVLVLTGVWMTSQTGTAVSKQMQRSSARAAPSRPGVRSPQRSMR